MGRSKNKNQKGSSYLQAGPIQFIGPSTDWSAEDALYSHFKTWKLKCKNILEAELASMPDTMEALLRWSGNQGVIMCQASNLQPE